MKKLIFIAGSPRSGTTALTRLIAASYDVHHVTARELGTNIDSKETWESGIFGRITNDEAIVDRFEKIDCIPPYLLEKTPDNIFHINRILKVFPDSKIIIPIRSGVDVVKSLQVAKETFLEEEPNFKKSCRQWRQSTEIIVKLPKDSRILLVDYERFMADKHGTAENIFKFLGISTRNISECVNEMQNNAKERVKGVVGRSITGGQQSFTVREVLLFVRLCGFLEYRVWKLRRSLR
ncbi:hypothetical protein GCM10007094_00450 [Pseudovibrio japonicus]|uniref:Sulfotransferase domain-containing protein n=1 Tax=Pseudovibrio japonicus TaxID=366534 RepID=A0ABQ3DXQ5_9HYPH|nr:sulfotransferase [Pseudovibrio japonicus]GHB16969.1 hypothetical protein GCM10007094_00450 [Pseudovibrio japonicus]